MRIKQSSNTHTSQLVAFLSSHKDIFRIDSDFRGPEGRPFLTRNVLAGFPQDMKFIVTCMTGATVDKELITSLANSLVLFFCLVFRQHNARPIKIWRLVSE